MTRLLTTRCKEIARVVSGRGHEKWRTGKENIARRGLATGTEQTSRVQT